MIVLFEDVYLLCLFTKIDCLSAFLLLGTVRVKGGMSLRNGMWHGLLNDIIMWNVIYAE